MVPLILYLFSLKENKQGNCVLFIHINKMKGVEVIYEIWKLVLKCDNLHPFYDSLYDLNVGKCVV